MSRTKLSFADKKYIACALDSEGWISFVQRPDRKSFQVMIGFGNTSKAWLKNLQKLMGCGGISGGGGARVKKGWKPSFCLQLCCQNARWLLEEIYPFLIIKKKRARLVLSIKFLDKSARRKLSKREITRRQGLVERMRLLNKRGRIA